MNKNEDILWQRIRHANVDAFNTFFELYWERMFQYAFKITGSKEDAEELVQDHFVNLWNKKEQLPEVSCVEAYMLGAMRNRILNHLAKRKIKLATLEDAVDNCSLFSASEKVETLESEKMLALCMRSLPQKMQEVFYMHRVNELSVAEIAAQTNTSQQTVRNQLNTACKKMRAIVTKATPLIIALVQKKFLS